MTFELSAGAQGTVLVVCTGNICRSPFAERLLQRSLPDPIRVCSAGTAAVEGAPMDPQAAALLRRYGGDDHGFVARQLTPQMVAAADLVLTATRAHRAAVATLWPPSLRYLFCLTDFSDLAAPPWPDQSPGPRECSVAAVATQVAARRGTFPPRPAQEADIVDPYRRAERYFVAMADQIVALLPAIVTVLSPSSAGRERPALDPGPA